MKIVLKGGMKVFFRVDNVTLVQDTDGPKIRFYGSTLTDPAAEFYMKPETAARQIGRNNYDYTTVLGQTVEFEKMLGTPGYININRADPLGTGNSTLAVQAASAPVPNAMPLPPATPPHHPAPPLLPPSHAQEAQMTHRVATWEYLFAAHTSCVNQVIAQNQKLIDADIAFSPESFAAQVSTLLIAAQKLGLLNQ